MKTDREQRIRMLASRIWESEGRPDDQDKRHWEMAERIVEAENAPEEESSWHETASESPFHAGKNFPVEIDESRLTADGAATKTLEEENTDIELTAHPSQAKSSRDSKAKKRNTNEGKPAPRKRTATKIADSESSKSLSKSRNPQDSKAKI